MSDDPADDGAGMSSAEAMSDADHLERIADARHPLSTAHDELPIIVQNQT